MTAASYSKREAKFPYRTAVRAAPRVVGSTAGRVAIYYLRPLDHSSTWTAVTRVTLFASRKGFSGRTATVTFAVLTANLRTVRHTHTHS